MNGLIYMRTSPSGRRYIGQTTKKEEERWKEHVYSATHKGSSEWKTPLSASIRKYGGDSFTVKILESGIRTPEELNEREIYWIKHYHTLISENQNGLNVTIGGVGYRKYTNDDFERLYSEGYTIGDIAKVTGANPMTVSAHLQADKSENYSRSRRKALKKNPPRSVSNYDVHTCEKINTFPSAADAALFYTGKRDRNLVLGAINGSSNTAFGYIWNYDDLPMSNVYERSKRCKNQKANRRGKPVINVETGEIFKTISEASKVYGVSWYAIAACCTGDKDNINGYHFQYKGEEFEPYKKQWKKPVICIETQTMYSSVTEAAKQTGLNQNHITDCLKKRRDSVGGYHWKYQDENMSGYYKNKNSRFKSVVCIETGTVYESIHEAAYSAHVNYTNLCTCLRGQYKTCGGLHWAYISEKE